MRDLANQGLTVVFTTSDLKETHAVADRILVMAHGRVTADVRAEGATDEALIWPRPNTTPRPSPPEEKPVDQPKPSYRAATAAAPPALLASAEAQNLHRSDFGRRLLFAVMAPNFLALEDHRHLSASTWRSTPYSLSA